MRTPVRYLTKDKVMREIVAAAIEQGWSVRRRKRSTHLQFRAPCGEALVTAPSTPSDWRSMKNMRADLRRAGLVI